MGDEKHRITQFRNAPKHVHEVDVLGGEDYGQGRETGAGLYCQVGAGNIGAARSDPCLRRVRPHPADSGQLFQFVGEVDDREAFNVERLSGTAVSFDEGAAGGTRKMP
jgi:hypothetical protein